MFRTQRDYSERNFGEDIFKRNTQYECNVICIIPNA